MSEKKVIVVTGASSSFGNLAARALARPTDSSSRRTRTEARTSSEPSDAPGTFWTVGSKASRLT
ncbi:hypothetical protein ACFQ0G_05190 [Streptomyces chiangmaiensis]